MGEQAKQDYLVILREKLAGQNNRKIIAQATLEDAEVQIAELEAKIADLEN